MAWTQEQEKAYWDERYPPSREQLVSDLPKEEYEPEYHQPKIIVTDFQIEMALLRQENNGKLPVKPYLKIDHYYVMTDENDVRDWRILT